MAKKYEIIVERDASRVSLDIGQVVPALPAIIAAPDAAQRAEAAASSVEGMAEQARIWAESELPPDPGDLTRKSSRSWALDAQDAADRAEATVAVGNIAALQSLEASADQMAFFDGAGSMALTGLTEAARDLLDDASFAAMRDTLGLGSAATATVTASATDITEGRLLATGAGPAQAFRRGNILGTVSRSGGVPTGAVIEGDTVSSGAYVRFADGTQLCWQGVASSAVNEASGSIFMSTEESWIFPKPFSSAPRVFLGSGGSTIIWGIGASDSATAGKYRVFRAGSTTSTYALSLLAVGRWN